MEGLPVEYIRLRDLKCGLASCYHRKGLYLMYCNCCAHSPCKSLTPEEIAYYEETRKELAKLYPKRD